MKTSNTKRKKRGWIAAAALLLAPGTHAAQNLVTVDDVRVDENEQVLLEILDDVRAARLPMALEKAKRLVERNPKFRLAQLVYADLLMAQDRPVASFGGTFARNNNKVGALRDEARRRIAHQRQEPHWDQGMWPEYLIQLSSRQRHVIVVDASVSRLHVFANTGDRLKLVGDSYVSVGKKGMLKVKEGDQRSPVGVYFVTSRLDRSGLSDFYGSAALPINYPNEWDRRLGRTGYGIWLHGVPSDTHNREPFISDGCLALPNRDMALLSKTVDTGTTPVIIADRVNWVSAQENKRQREDFLARLEQWRQDWESRDDRRYARHYAKTFRSGTMNYERWIRHKRRVAKQKTFIKVRLDDISVFQYPGEADLMVATFHQDYRSSNFNTSARKRQYWRKEADGVWRIVYEKRANFLPIHFRGIPYSARSKLSKSN
jgi:murein L,D-transpeptidase YafK